MTLLRKVAPANLVPAAAVIRGGRALFAQTGRKVSLGGSSCVSSLSIERYSIMFAKTVFLEF